MNYIDNISPFIGAIVNFEFVERNAAPVTSSLTMYLDLINRTSRSRKIQYEISKKVDLFRGHKVFGNRTVNWNMLDNICYDKYIYIFGILHINETGPTEHSHQLIKRD